MRTSQHSKTTPPVSPFFPLSSNSSRRFRPSLTCDDRAGWDRYREASALLHALIVTGRTAPAGTLAKFATTFPAAALVLVARLPVAERTPLLLNWYHLGDQAHGGQLTRASAMLLAKAPPSGFAADIIANTSASLYLAVLSPGYSMGSASCSGACGDGPAGPSDTTWPPLFSYRLQPGNPGPQARLLVAAGDLRMFYVAMPDDPESSHCGNDQPDFHHAVLSEMLAVPEKDLPWQTTSQQRIGWLDPTQFSAEVQQRVAAERAALDSTAHALATKGLMTPSDGDPRASLVVHIDDRREDKSEILPNVQFRDPRISLAPANLTTP